MDQRCLQETDYSNVRVLLRLDHRKEVLAKLLVRNPRGMPAAIVRLQVVHYWIQDPGAAEPGDYSFIRAEHRTGAGWGRSAGGNPHGWHARGARHGCRGAGGARDWHARGPPTCASVTLALADVMRGLGLHAPFPSRGPHVPFGIVILEHEGVRTVFVHGVLQVLSPACAGRPRLELLEGPPNDQ